MYGLFSGAFTNTPRLECAVLQPRYVTGASSIPVGYRVRPGRPGVNSLVGLWARKSSCPNRPGCTASSFWETRCPRQSGFVNYLDEWLKPRGNVAIIRATSPGYTSYQEVLFYKKFWRTPRRTLVL